MASRRRAVHVELGHPVQGVLDEVAPDFVAVRSVKIDGVAPGSPVFGGKIGTEIVQIVAVRAEMVVDDIEDNGEPLAVAGIDQRFQTPRARRS